jgi:hypothetical protein
VRIGLFVFVDAVGVFADMADFDDVVVVGVVDTVGAAADAAVADVAVVDVGVVGAAVAVAVVVHSY